MAVESAHHAPATGAAAARTARLFARDAAVVGAAGLIWWLAAPLSAGDGALADLAGVFAGLVLGLCALPLHEWGHWLGAVASRSAIHPARGLRSLFVFGFDSHRNSSRQFLVMTLGGWLATGAALWAAYALLPGELLATRVARGMMWLSVLLVIAIEVPLLTRTLWTGKLPPVDDLAGGEA